MARCRDERIEPPTSGRIDRIIRSALSRGENLLFAQAAKKAFRPPLLGRQNSSILTGGSTKAQVTGHIAIPTAIKIAFLPSFAVNSIPCPHAERRKSGLRPTCGTKKPVREPLPIPGPAREKQNRRSETYRAEIQDDGIGGASRNRRHWSERHGRLRHRTRRPAHHQLPRSGGTCLQAAFPVDPAPSHPST